MKYNIGWYMTLMEKMKLHFYEVLALDDHEILM